MDEILIGAADDVVIGDGDGVDAAAAGLQDVDALQRPDVPNLKHRERESKNHRGLLGGREGGNEGEGKLEEEEGFFGRGHPNNNGGKSEPLDAFTAVSVRRRGNARWSHR